VRYAMNRVLPLLIALLGAATYGAAAFELPGTETILDPRVAFVPQLISTDGNLTLEWQIAPGYYLYRDKTEIYQHDQHHRTRLKPTFAAGAVVFDEEFGKQVVYRLATEMQLTCAPHKTGKEVTIEVIFQGCKEGRLCYPPTTVTLPVP